MSMISVETSRDGVIIRDMDNEIELKLNNKDSAFVLECLAKQAKLVIEYLEYEMKKEN